MITPCNECSFYTKGKDACSIGLISEGGKSPGICRMFCTEKSTDLYELRVQQHKKAGLENNFDAIIPLTIGTDIETLEKTILNSFSSWGNLQPNNLIIALFKNDFDNHTELVTKLLGFRDRIRRFKKIIIEVVLEDTSDLEMLIQFASLKVTSNYFFLLRPGSFLLIDNISKSIDGYMHNNVHWSFKDAAPSNRNEYSGFHCVGTLSKNSPYGLYLTQGYKYIMSLYPEKFSFLEKLDEVEKKLGIKLSIDKSEICI